MPYSHRKTGPIQHYRSTHQTLKLELKRYNLCFRLKLSRLSAERTDCGKLFHAFGPAIENALSPNLVL